MSAQLYAGETIWSILDMKLLNQTVTSPQIIKYELELGEDNEDVLIEGKSGTLTISGTQTFSNFLSLEDCNLSPVHLLNNKLLSVKLYSKC